MSGSSCLGKGATRRKDVDVLVIGCGPAGLQAAQVLKEQGADFLVLEREDRPGSFFSTFPRHRTLISITKRYNFFEEPGFNERHDWNTLIGGDQSLKFSDFYEGEDLFPPADALVDYLNAYMTRNQLETHIEFGTQVLHITRESSIDEADSRFLISTKRTTRSIGTTVADTDTDEEVQYSCRRLLLGLGVDEAFVPDIDGIQLADTYEHHDLDVNRYRNQRVLVVGGGNSGFETANHLSNHAAIVHVAIKRPIKMAWDTHFVGDLRAVNAGFVDFYQLKSLHATIGDPPVSMRRCDDGIECTFVEWVGNPYIAVGELELRRVYDHVILCTGVKWVHEKLLDDAIRPLTHTDGKYPQLRGNWECANVPNLFYIGGAMQANDRKAASGFIHGFRYETAALCRLLTDGLESLEVLQTCDGCGDDATAAIAGDGDGDGGTPSDGGADGRQSERITKAILSRLTTAASLFQCFGVMCDVLVISNDKTQARLYVDIPRPYVMELLAKEKSVGEGDTRRGSSSTTTTSSSASDDIPPSSLPERLSAFEHIFIITFQFGFDRYNKSELRSNHFIQDTGLLSGRCGAFLHPVLQHVSNGVVCDSEDEIHLQETLDIRFTDPYRPGSSASSLNSKVLHDAVQHVLWPGTCLTDEHGSALPPARLLGNARADAATKADLFCRLLPLKKVWTPGEMQTWREHVAARKHDEKERAECVLHPLPIHRAELESAGMA